MATLHARDVMEKYGEGRVAIVKKIAGTMTSVPE
jgi:hypothetical protein